MRAAGDPAALGQVSADTTAGGVGVRARAIAPRPGCEAGEKSRPLNGVTSRSPALRAAVREPGDRLQRLPGAARVWRPRLDRVAQRLDRVAVAVRGMPHRHEPARLGEHQEEDPIHDGQRLLEQRIERLCPRGGACAKARRSASRPQPRLPAAAPRARWRSDPSDAAIINLQRACVPRGCGRRRCIDRPLAEGSRAAPASSSTPRDLEADPPPRVRARRSPARAATHRPGAATQRAPRPSGIVDQRCGALCGERQAGRDWRARPPPPAPVGEHARSGRRVRRRRPAAPRTRGARPAARPR
jgi:hypothetical protein